jgi:hypothetical protein
MAHFLTHLLQDLLMERFPKFAYWLFYSEMVAAIVIGLVLIFFPAEAIFGGVFILYAASNWVGASNYARKRALKEKQAWAPSRFDRAVAIFLNLGFGLAGGFLLYFLRDNWLMIAMGIALIAIALFNLVALCSGRWVDYP